MITALFCMHANQIIWRLKINSKMGLTAGTGFDI